MVLIHRCSICTLRSGGRLFLRIWRKQVNDDVILFVSIKWPNINVLIIIFLDGGNSTYFITLLHLRTSLRTW